MTESIHRFSHRYVSFPVPSAVIRTLALLGNFKPRAAAVALPFSSAAPPCHAGGYVGGFCALGSRFPLSLPQRRTATRISAAGWFSGLGAKKGKGTALPEIVKAGDPVLHEPADEVPLQEIGSEKIQKIIEDMVAAMRKAPGVGLAAPQIGVPLKVIVNPKLKKKSNKTAYFFEGCLSVDGFRAVVERYLEVEVSGLDRNGNPVKIDATGWQARILQHECDHLDGTLYVDKMVPRTFRTVENLDLPMAKGCPPLGTREILDGEKIL